MYSSLGETSIISNLYYIFIFVSLILQDELQTTTRNYEGQLAMMSDHLAGMNEKLARQKDEIDALKLQVKVT